MNMSSDQANQFISELEKSDWPKSVDAIIAPPNIYLTDLCEISDQVKIAAQNCHSEKSGAYTGEVSAPMILAIGVSYCLVGHSERREYFKETGSFLKEKVDSLLSEGLTPIYCCGEVKSERENGTYFSVIKNQLEESVFHLANDEIVKLVIAYEPVWAIGTGLTATAVEAQEMHAFIRKTLSDKYGDEVAQSISILYGGSCKPANASELFSCEDVDGGLIGGASLEVGSFVQIAQSF